MTLLFSIGAIIILVPFAPIIARAVAVALAAFGGLGFVLALFANLGHHQIGNRFHVPVMCFAISILLFWVTASIYHPVVDSRCTSSRR